MNQSKNNLSIQEVIQEKNQESRDKKYNAYVESMTPKHNIIINLFNAFWIGGIICTLGQLCTQLYIYLGAGKELASAYTTVTLVFLSVLATGLNIYDKLAKYGGAGTVVPITGFANSVAAPAIEYKKEGQVFGIGCKIFTICGPVILYGIFSSWVYGIVYYILKVM